MIEIFIMVYKRRTAEISLFYGAKACTHEKARILRNNMTYHEKIMWKVLRRKEIGGYRFRRQHPIFKFIVDFYCHELKLVIEIDGTYHNFQKEYDDGRTAELKNFGITVMRFTNNEVESNLFDIVNKIQNKIINLT